MLLVYSLSSTVSIVPNIVNKYQPSPELTNLFRLAGALREWVICSGTNGREKVLQWGQNSCPTRPC